jgi:glycosyltransferase involved in cell wall biosynthesis
MKISVITCTHNRCESLQRTLDSFKGMFGLDRNSWEFIIVDNNSKDKTRIIVDNFRKDFESNVKYVFEKKQGLSRARNRGIKNADGEIIAFTDDDVLFDKYWLLIIQRIFEKYEVACVGGKTLPIWEIPRPTWLLTSLYGMLALLDLGDTPFYVTDPLNIFGVNFAVRAIMFKKYGYFNTNLGRTPDRLFSGEETELFFRLLDGGEKFFYCPDMIVHHCIPSTRISKDYFRRWVFDAAESNAAFLEIINRRALRGLPNYSIKTFLRSLVIYILGLICFSKRRFNYELRFINQLSYFIRKKELWRYIRETFL